MVEPFHFGAAPAPLVLVPAPASIVSRGSVFKGLSWRKEKNDIKPSPDLCESSLNLNFISIHFWGQKMYLQILIRFSFV